MSFCEIKSGSEPGFTIHYELEGDPNRPVLVFSNSLGTNLSLWDPQMAEFSKYFRVLRYDSRGHGESTTPAGPYSINELGQDVLTLLDLLDIDKVAFCGLSMGGMVGQWLGSNFPDRLTRLVLCNTAARIGTVDGWNARIEKVRAERVKAVVPEVLERWFTPGFRAAMPGVVAATGRMLGTASAEGYAASCEAIRDMDQRDTVARIQAPTLIVVGSEDPVTPPAEGIFLAEQIAGAQYLELRAAHLSNIEAASEFIAGVTRFLVA